MSNEKTEDETSAPVDPRVDEALTVLSKISDPSNTRNDVARAYQIAVGEKSNIDIDWRNVDQAIIKRWSRSALQVIKQRAWSYEG